MLQLSKAIQIFTRNSQDIGSDHNFSAICSEKDFLLGIDDTEISGNHLQAIIPFFFFVILFQK